MNIYLGNETNFNNNGLGFLTDTISAMVHDELNGNYELTLEYVLNGHLAEYLEKENIIKCEVADGTKQLFRITNVSKNFKTIQITAKHIFYDLINNFLEDTYPQNLNGQNFLNHILNNTDFQTSFTGVSDIINTKTARYVRINPVQAIMGDIDNSMTKIFGGELKRDNFTINFLSRVGQDNGVKLIIGKNITGINVSVDITEMATRVMPLGYDGLMLPEKYVDSPLINNYPTPKIAKLEFSDVKVDENTTEQEAYTELRRLVNEQYSLGLDKPKVNISINWVELSKTEEYKQYASLETVRLGDTITAQILDMNYETRVIAIDYNVLKGMITNFQIGTFAPTIASSINAIQTKVDEINPSSILAEATQNATELITTAMGGYIYKTQNELYIMDSSDPQQAQKVWRWNINGLGYSSTGINGPYGLAMTMDGSIVADFITTGTLNTNVIQGYDTLTSQVQGNVEVLQKITTTEGSATGSSINIPSARQEPLLDLQLQGDTYQQTYSGKNLFNKENVINNANINSSGQIISDIYKLYYVNVQSNETYTMSIGKNRQWVYAFYETIPQLNSTGSTRIVNTSINETFTVPSGYNYIAIREVSDTVESIINLQLERGSQATSYEPYVGGTPSPNPSYPQSVETVTGRQEVQVCGKNLIKPLDSGSQNGLTFTTNDDGITTISGTASGNVVYYKYLFETIPAGTYTLSVNLSYAPPANSSQLILEDTSNNRLATINLWSTLNKTFTISKETELKDIYFYSNTGISHNGTISIQLEKGSQATEYQPYISNTYEINLGKNLLNYNVSSNTVNDITFTVNSDKTISVKGTASANSAFNIFTNNFNLPKGTYTLSGCPAGGGDETYYLAANLTGSTIKDTGNGITFTLTTDNTNRSIWLYVLAGQNVDLVFKPMLEKGSSKTEYQPYKMSPNKFDVNDYRYIYFRDNFATHTVDNDSVMAVTTDESSDSGVWFDMKSYIKNFNTATKYYISFNAKANQDLTLRYGSDNTYLDKQIGITKQKLEIAITGNNLNAFIFYSRNERAGDTFEISDIEVVTENIIELCKIGNYQDSIKKATGKNLFDYTKVTGGWVGYDGTTYDQYTDTYCYSELIPVEPSTTYTLNLYNSSSLGSAGVNEYNSSKTFIQGTAETSTTITFTTSSTTAYILFTCRQDSKTQVQLEKGSQATEYDPYGTNWYIEKKIGKVVLDGSEDWVNVSTNRFSLNINNVKAGSSGNPNVISNYYNGNYSFNNYSIFSGSVGNQISIIDNRYSLADFKTWLSTHNTEVYYVLATPTYEITDTDLIGELEDIELLEGANNIDVISENLPAILDIDYYTLTPLGNTYATTSTTHRLSTRITQTAASIELSATDNGTSCGLTIKLRNEDGTELSEEQANITLSGKVSFTDLSGTGTTTINGDNITTGNIKSSNYVANTSGTKISLTDGTIDTKNFKVSSTGDITANSGTIGGWNLTNVWLQKSVGNYSIEIRSDRPSNEPTILVWDGQNNRYNWYVRPDGYMYARNCEIDGGEIKSSNYVANTSGTKINLADGSIDSKNFKVDATGNITATNATLTGGEIKSSNYVSGTSGTKINLTDGTIDSKNFKVNSTGDITAASGTIGGWVISDIGLSKYTSNGYGIEIRSDKQSNEAALLVWDNNNSRYNWYVQPDGFMFARNCEIHGTVYATNGSFSGSITSTNGEIGGWTIDGSSGLSGGSNVYLYKDGRMSLKKKGWFNAGDAGYWLLGNYDADKNEGPKVLIGDDYSLGNNIDTALTAQFITGSGQSSTISASAGIITQNGPILIQAVSNTLGLKANNMNLYALQNMTIAVEGTLNYRVNSLYMNGDEGRTVTITYRNSANQNRDLYFKNGILVGYT